MGYGYRYIVVGIYSAGLRVLRPLRIIVPVYRTHISVYGVRIQYNIIFLLYFNVISYYVVCPRTMHARYPKTAEQHLGGRRPNSL